MLCGRAIVFRRLKIAENANCDLFNAQTPDVGHGFYARSCRANRDVDVRR